MIGAGRPSSSGLTPSLTLIFRFSDAASSFRVGTPPHAVSDNNVSPVAIRLSALRRVAIRGGNRENIWKILSYPGQPLTKASVHHEDALVNGLRRRRRERRRRRPQLRAPTLRPRSA